MVYQSIEQFRSEHKCEDIPCVCHVFVQEGNIYQECLSCRGITTPGFCRVLKKIYEENQRIQSIPQRS